MGMASTSNIAAETSAALAKIHESVKRLRNALSNSVSLRANLQIENNKTPSPTVLKQLQTEGHQMLVQAVTAKLAHDSIIHHVTSSRASIRADQEALLETRLQLENLAYEKRMLQQQIAACRSVNTEFLGKLDIPLPEVNTESDEAASEAHTKFMAALNGELARRKRVRDQVDAVVEQTKSKRRQLTETKNALRDLPRAIRSLAPVIDPIRKLLTVDETSIGSAQDLVRVRRLPGPLYVLARTALAYREVMGGIEVTPVGEPLTDREVFEKKKREDAYCLHPLRVRIDVKGEKDAPLLRVTFGYFVNLEIVGVSSVIVADGQETPSFPTKELQMLYPMDFGEDSPNPCNVYRGDGTFTFDVTKAHGLRPYIWANLACGVPCLQQIASPVVREGEQFGGWPAKAWEHPEHLRFRDVVETLQQRLRAIVALKQQVESLMSKRLPVAVSEIGLGKEAKAKLEDFVKLAPQEWASHEGLRRPGTDGKYTEVWGIALSKGELKVNCMVGVEPDYPVGPPVFKLHCENTVGSVTERDIVELERCVNEFQVEGSMAARKDMLLGAKIMALLTYVDRLVTACDNLDEGILEGGAGEIKGRTRSKRDAILTSSSGP